MPPEQLTFALLMRYPTYYLKKFVQYTLGHLPDTSERAKIDPLTMQYWKRYTGGKTKPDKTLAKKMHHKFLPALQGRLVNFGADFGISHNQWPVVFRCKDGTVVSMVFKFAVHVWIAYCSKMKGHPSPTSNAAQKVLLYLVSEQEMLCKTWRNRLYYYSSGSIMQTLQVDFNTWMTTQGVEKAQKAIRKVCLRCLLVPSPDFFLTHLACLQVLNTDGLYGLVGAAIFEVIQRKPQPFPQGCSSKAAYTKISPWKRAMIYVFLARFLCKKKAQQRWMNYSETDYQFNVRVFRRYLLVDADILRHTQPFLDLPATAADTLQGVKKRKRKRSGLTTASESEAIKMRYRVDSSSSGTETADGSASDKDDNESYSTDTDDSK